MKETGLRAVALLLLTTTVGWVIAAPEVGHYEVQKSNKTCLKAQAALQLLVNTTIGLGPTKFDINPIATIADGICSNMLSTLFLQFREGHLLFVFEKGHKNAILKTITANLTLTSGNSTRNYQNSIDLKAELAPTNRSFLCHSQTTVVLGMDLTLVTANVQVQPFGITNETFSPETKCSADLKPTTPSPTPTPPHNHTTHSPKPTTKPPAPTTKPPAPTTKPPAPTTKPPAPPTTPPSPTPPPSPSKGNYSLTVGNRTCLIALLALRINVDYVNQTSKKVAHGIFNLDPKKTKVSGTCDPSSPVLNLTYPEGFLNFTFKKNESKFYLHVLQGELKYLFPNAAPGEIYKGANSSLKLFEASVGNSYACVAEQYASLNNSVNHTVRVAISQVQLQPFNVTSPNLATAEKCSQDTDSMLIPIIVGSVLAALVIVVLVAYIIGRHRSHSGYQSI